MPDPVAPLPAGECAPITKVYNPPAESDPYLVEVDQNGAIIGADNLWQNIKDLSGISNPRETSLKRLLAQEALDQAQEQCRLEVGPRFPTECPDPTHCRPSRSSRIECKTSVTRVSEWHLILGWIWDDGWAEFKVSCSECELACVNKDVHGG